LSIYEDAQRVEDEQELTVGKLDGAQSVDRVERQESEDLKVI
jgi:hypothetical protein